MSYHQNRTRHPETHGHRREGYGVCWICKQYDFLYTEMTCCADCMNDVLAETRPKADYETDGSTPDPTPNHPFVLTEAEKYRQMELFQKK